MLLDYILSALAKPELAANGIELFLRLIFSAEIRRHCATCLEFGRNQAGRVSRIVMIFAVAGIMAVAEARCLNGGHERSRTRRRAPSRVAARRRRARSESR